MFPVVYVARDRPAVCKRLADVIADCCARSKSGIIAIGLSGGSLIDILADALPLAKLNYDRIRLFFCDERLVPFDSTESTYGEYIRKVIPKVPNLTTRNFLPIDPSLPAESCALAYERELVRSFGKGADPTPLSLQFDCLLLGIGPDGHICSLFPGHPALEIRDHVVTSVVDSPKPPSQRITLTLSGIYAARSIVFVVTGSAKAHIMKKVFGDDPSLPATMAVKVSEVFYVVDEEVTSLVKKY